MRSKAILAASVLLIGALILFLRSSRSADELRQAQDHELAYRLDPGMTPPESYLDPANRRSAWLAKHGWAVPLTKLGLGRWVRGNRCFRDVDGCLKMTPPTHMHGLFVYGEETQHFFPNVTSLGLRELNRSSDIWMELGPDEARRALPPTKRYGDVILIDFIGRRTIYPGHFGHLGAADSEVIVDRVISARSIDRD